MIQLHCAQRLSIVLPPWEGARDEQCMCAGELRKKGFWRRPPEGGGWLQFRRIHQGRAAAKTRPYAGAGVAGAWLKPAWRSVQPVCRPLHKQVAREDQGAATSILAGIALCPAIKTHRGICVSQLLVAVSRIGVYIRIGGVDVDAFAATLKARLPLLAGCLCTSRLPVCPLHRRLYWNSHIHRAH